MHKELQVAAVTLAHLLLHMREGETQSRGASMEYGNDSMTLKVMMLGDTGL